MKDQLELLFQQAGSGEENDKGMNMTAISSLAEDLRDVLFDYQVSTGILTCKTDTRLTRPSVVPAKRDLQPKLYTDRESQDLSVER